MSSRALRKAQREREEQDKAKRLESGTEDQSEEDIPVRPVKKSAFALLSAPQEDGESEVEHESGGDGDAADNNEQVSRPNPSAKMKKKKKKKKRKKHAHAGVDAPTPDGDLDEIDLALKQLSTNGNAFQPATTVAGVNVKTLVASKLLAIDPHHLRVENEMRRLFGRTTMAHDEYDEEAQPHNAGANRQQHGLVQQLGPAQDPPERRGARSGVIAAMNLRRNIFVRGQEDWPAISGGGLGMKVEEKKPDGTVWYRFVHSSGYSDVQEQFHRAVSTMDPMQLIAILQRHPYSIATLLQVSEIAKHDGEHTTSGVLLERALFSFGRAVHSTFANNLSKGTARLNFAHEENREFWLASWRYLSNLTMRATWRTVYEWAKLLLALAPDEDPYAVALVLDQYALRARQDLDYLNLSRSPAFPTAHQNSPNVLFSRALAEWRGGTRNKGQQALFHAVGQYPWVAARLLMELGLVPPPAIRDAQPRSPREALHAELYAIRGKDIWGVPEATGLLVETASALPLDTPTAPVDDAEIAPNEARQVLLDATPTLVGFLQRRYTIAPGTATDPLPPSQPQVPSAATGDEMLATGEGMRRVLQEMFALIEEEEGGFQPWVEDAEDDGG